MTKVLLESKPKGLIFIIGIPDLFHYSYENEFLHNKIRSGHRGPARSFNLCYKYTDDLIVLNNGTFSVYPGEIHPGQLTNQITWHATLISDSLWTAVVGFQPGFMTNVMILTPTLSILHSFLVTYHLDFLMVYIYIAADKICTMQLSLG